MKKRIANPTRTVKALAVLAALSLKVFAFGEIVESGSGLKIVPVDSDIYQVIKALYIAQGLALPSTTGPWSEGELKSLLDRIDTAKLKKEQLKAYDYASKELAPHSTPFRFNFTPSLELHAHTNTENFTTPDYYLRHPNLMRPMLSFSTEAWFLDTFYVLGVLDVGTSVINTTSADPSSNGAKYPSSTLYGETAFSTNIWMVPPSSMEDFEWITPKRSFLVAGKESGKSGWYFSIGRDRLSWGPGESGNFMVGDHVDFHNNARLVLHNPNIKYTFNISAFESPLEFYSGAEWTPKKGNNYIDGVNLFIAHRFEGRILKDKLGFAVTEAIMYQPSPDKLIFDPTVFLPTVILHNLYRFEEMNSLMTVELDYTPIPFLNIYAQLALDELSMPGDSPITTTTSNIPNSFAYMLGVQSSFSLGAGIFNASLEGVYTDPYLYLRSSSHSSQGIGERGINYIVANRATFPDIYYEEFLGYRWGGDAVVVNAHAGYRQVGKWNVEANILFMVHGTFDKWTTYSEVYKDGTLNTDEPEYHATPTEEHPTTLDDNRNHADSNAGVRNSVSILTGFSILGSWNIWRNMEIYGQADLVHIVNPGNRKENAPITDLQFTIGVSYKF